MAMTRRNFIEAGIGGAAALAVAQGVSRAHSLDAGLGITVVGVDGADLTVPYLDDYLSVGATVWQYSQNTIDFDRFDDIKSFVDANSSKVTLAKSYSDILAAKHAGKVAMVVGVQDMWPLEWQWRWIWQDAQGMVVNAGPNDYTQSTPVTDLSKYYDRGLRIGNLSYQLSTSFGGGLLDPTTPLSIAGEYMVDQMQEIGILVDCTHSSEQTTLDIIKRAKRPVVFSHSNVLALNNNIRNISDDQIKGIADTGGLIGVNAVNAYLKWSTEDAPNAVTGPFPSLATLSQYVDVMDYIRGLVGIDYIGLGTDFTYGNPPDYAGTHFPNPPSFALPPTMLYYSPYLEYVHNFSGVADLPHLLPELVRHGYSPVEITKILGGNWLRVFRQAWNS
jgi:microsomal dipeptidase-like Zn-dependent dipeptidase